MGYYKIKSHAGTGKLLNIAASGPISGRKNTNIWDESCPIDQTWSIASLGNNQQVKIINNLSYMLNAAMPDTHIAKQRIIIGKLGFFNIMTS